MRPLDKDTKEMQGTFEASREDFTPVSYENFEKAPNVPGEWPLEAQTIWRDLWGLLRGSGYLSKGFILSVRNFAWRAYRVQLAESKLLDKPDDSYWEKVMDTNGKALERYLKSFGMTPADLYRVPAIKKDDSKTMSLLK